MIAVACLDVQTQRLSNSVVLLRGDPVAQQQCCRVAAWRPSKWLSNNIGRVAACRPTDSATVVLLRADPVAQQQCFRSYKVLQLENQIFLNSKPIRIKLYTYFSMNEEYF